MLILVTNESTHTKYKNIGKYTDDEVRRRLENWYDYYDDWLEVEKFMEDNLEKVEVVHSDSDDYWYVCQY